MSCDFDISDWRRDLEQAIRDGETSHIRLLLDRIEAEYDDLQREADDWMGDSHGMPRSQENGSDTSPPAAEQAP